MHPGDWGSMTCTGFLWMIHMNDSFHTNDKNDNIIIILFQFTVKPSETPLKYTTYCLQNQSIYKEPNNVTCCMVPLLTTQFELSVWAQIFFTILTYNSTMGQTITIRMFLDLQYISLQYILWLYDGAIVQFGRILIIFHSDVLKY